MKKQEIKDPSFGADTKSSPKVEIDYRVLLNSYIENSIGSPIDKMQNFAKYIPRQNLTRFLSKYELLKKVINVTGSILECGVFYGGGTMSFAQISSILEPVNSQRLIVGFDTFSGFEDVHDQDKTATSEHAKKGGLAVDSYTDLQEAIKLYDMNRFLGHMQKVKLVKGDVTVTMPKYLKENPHTLVSLLYLDMDVYKPTLETLKNVLPRMPKGSIIAFDQLNCDKWPGETVAMLEGLDIRQSRVERFPFDTFLSYVVLD